MTQLSKHPEFDPSYLQRQLNLNQQFYEQKKTPADERGYGIGLIKPSDTGFLNFMLGKEIRMPGEYHLTNPNNGEQLPELLQNTCEFVHPCVGIASNSAKAWRRRRRTRAVAGSIRLQR